MSTSVEARCSEEDECMVPIKREASVTVTEILKMNTSNDHFKTDTENWNELPTEDVCENNNDGELIEKSTEFKPKVLWLKAIITLTLHVAALYGLMLIALEAKFLTILWFVVSLSMSTLGITMGAHRLFCHRSFKANKWIQLTLVAFQTMGGENSVFVWTRVHRQHHKYSDTNADPHNSNRGFFFCHMAWLFLEEHPEVVRTKKGIDMSDLIQNPIVMFQKKYYKEIFVLLSILFPTLVPYYLWNESLWNSFFICSICRWMATLNFVFTINSIAHRYGTRPFKKDIAPTENIFAAFLSLGEGWHNYHHTFPWDYRAAEYGQDYNFTTTVIDFCAKNGWVYDVKTASPDLIKKYSSTKGDGTHPLFGKFTSQNWTYDF